MSFPIYYFLFAYLVFLFFWGVFGLIALYHIIKFGFPNFFTFFGTFVFIGGAIILLSVSYNYIAQVDWNTEVSPFQGLLNVNTPFPVTYK